MQIENSSDKSVDIYRGEMNGKRKYCWLEYNDS